MPKINKIVNYFVSAPSKKGGLPRVFMSPITIKSETARYLLEKQLREKAGDLSKKLFHVCYDVDSGMIYVPNQNEFSSDLAHVLLQAAKIKISKDFGGYAQRQAIEGSPYSSIRIRSINSFSYTQKTIEDHYKGKKITNLPVIEANLERMPKTVKQLPPEYKDLKTWGGYISPSVIPSVSFYDEYDSNLNKRQAPLLLLTQKTPFILINVSKKSSVHTSAKEWVVLAGYRDYLYDGSVEKENIPEEDKSDENLNKFADLYAIKRYLYLGWPFEEVSSYMLQEITSFPELLKGIQRLMIAVDSLKVEGYKDPSHHHYYLTFRIDPKDFPININSILDKKNGAIDPFKQYENFKIIDYDLNNSFILIETPIFITPIICKNILKAKSEPFICIYNPKVDKIDVKGDPRTMDIVNNEKIQKQKIDLLVRRNEGKTKEDKLEYRTGAMAQGESAINPNIFTVRKVSEYYYAYDHIKKICDLSKLEFKDFLVVIGPIERIFGRGTQGGFMDDRMFKKNKMKIPYEITKGVFISPPVIFINSESHPSYVDQTDTLIHEYTHYIYELQNPTHEIEYEQPKDNSQKKEYEFYYKYFKDPSEIAAHKNQIKYRLLAGQSIDEIIRDKVGGEITKENYPIALKFRELVDEVIKEIETEEKKNEEPIGKD